MKPDCFVHKDPESGATPRWASSSPSTPALWGVPLKYLSLVVLAVQNSALTLLMHASRVTPATASSESGSDPESRPYSAATAVLMSEVLKGVLSLLIAFSCSDGASVEASGMTPALYHRGNPKLRSLHRLWNEVFSPDCWKLTVPAVLYVLQNNLQYVAASSLPAATFQVTYQMKILTTAIFSVILLRKRLSSTQWLSLFFLAFGVGIVQIQAGVQAHASISFGTSSTKVGSPMNPLKGLSAVTAACFTSGLAGVYFEMMLKNSKTNLWIRNVQLSLFSVVPAVVPIIFSYRFQVKMTPDATPLNTLFSNFTPLAWATILVQVLGGLITAVVIKYADNILKGFATSLSIILSFAASVALFHFRMTGTFMLGSSIVLAATYLYNRPAADRPLRGPLPVIRDCDWSASTSEKVKGKAEIQSTPMPLQVTLTSPFGSTSSLSSTLITTHPCASQSTDILAEGRSSPDCHVRSKSAQL